MTSSTVPVRTPSTHSTRVDAYDHLDEKSGPSDEATDRRRRIVGTLLASLLLFASAAALNIALSWRHSSNTSRYAAPTRPFDKRASALPTDGLNISLNSLREPGEWYTSSDPVGGNDLFAFRNLTLAFGGWTNSTKNVDLIVDTTIIHQPVQGFGAAMTDSSAYLLKMLKDADEALYTRTMQAIFNPRTGVPILRVPLGSSDFALEAYTYLSDLIPLADFQAQLKAGKSKAILSKIQLGEAMTYTVPVLKDALAIRPDLRILFSPWSPPEVTKVGGDINGGELIAGYEGVVAQYYLRSLDAYVAEGIQPWGLTIQNEPSFDAPYPSCLMPTDTQARLAQALRSALTNGTTFTSLKNLVLLGHDNNFQKVQDAIDLSKAAGDALDGYAFHCYKGDPAQMGQLTDALARQKQSGKSLYMTECTGTYWRGKNRWASQLWWLSSLYFPAFRQDARAALIWNLALDPMFGPRLKTATCDNCVGALTISSPPATTSAKSSSPPFVRVGPQFLNINHLNVASQDLSRIGGGSAYRIGSWWGTPSDRTLNSTQLACLDALVFAAPLNGRWLPNPKTGIMAGQGPRTKRMGMVLVNECDQAIKLNMTVDGMPTSYTARPGLSTVVWMDR
ncbi:hypothetical protein OC834_003216 [Tilletia horrida]|nr:hypothetical protein OC834_003216 [Tilletia horrida]